MLAEPVLLPRAKSLLGSQPITRPGDGVVSDVASNLMILVVGRLTLQQRATVAVISLIHSGDLGVHLQGELGEVGQG